MRYLISILLCFSLASLNGQTTLKRLSKLMSAQQDTCCETRTKSTENQWRYYVLDYTDTVYFSQSSLVTNNLGSKYSVYSFNKRCQFLSFKEPISGIFYINDYGQDATTFTFSGELINGYIDNGFAIYYLPTNGKLRATGEYRNGWRVGIWTFYYPDGKIEFLWRYIEEATDPVISWAYDPNGKLIYFKVEQKGAEGPLNNKKR